MANDLQARDKNGTLGDGVTETDMVEVESRIELDELLQQRLEDAVGVFGMAGVLRVLGDITGKLRDVAGQLDEGKWGVIRKYIRRCAEDVERYETGMEE